MAPDNGSPWWVNFIKQVGVPAAIALFLLWFVVFQQNNKMEGIAVQMSAAQSNMSAYVVERRANDERMIELLKTQNNLMRINCVALSSIAKVPSEPCLK
jgi:hypothetical protein